MTRSALSLMARSAFAYVLLSLTTHAACHLLADVIAPITRPINRSAALKPRVLLFIHIAKCAGTTVRGIFHDQKWASTYWSLSQRFEGWKANRILHSVRLLLERGDHPRIFVEWHLSPNITIVPQMGAYVKMMMPDVEFVSFIILRSPTVLVASTGTYFNPGISPDIYIRTHADYFLFDVLGLPTIMEPNNRTCTDERRQQECNELITGWQLAGNRPFNASSEGSSAALRKASYMLSRMDARRATVESVGCASLTAAALRTLSNLDHVLFLEDNQTMQIVQRVARWRPAAGNLSFEQIAGDEKQQYTSPIKASASSDRWKKQVVAAYKSAKSRDLLSRENTCSLAAYAKILARYRRHDLTSAPHRT